MDEDITCIKEIDDEPVCPLPDGKQYHVFFSYREEDGEQEWIRMLTNELKTKYGFLCCNHTLDFTPGKKIVENIKEYINKSVKAVVLLSNEYTESPWCQMELETIIDEGIKRKEQILIPIFREDLTNIPDYLPLMTYIDARGPIEEWIHRLVSAIDSPVTNVKESCFTQRFLQHSNFKTLDTIYEETSRLTCTGKPFETRFIPDYLQRSGIDIYIQRRLKDNMKEPCLQEIDRNPDSSDDTQLLSPDDTQVDQQENAAELILNLSSDYFEDFLNGKIGYHIASFDSESKRHSTRAMCFCEYAELKKIISPSMPSDHPENVIVV